MTAGTHKVPKETKEATLKWGKFFSTGQMLVLILTVILDYGIYKGLNKIGLHWVAIFIDLAITAFVLIVIMGKMPPSKYLLGAGLPFWRIILQVLIHKKIHNCIYVRGYSDTEEYETEQKGESKLWGLSRIFQNM